MYLSLLVLLIISNITYSQQIPINKNAKNINILTQFITNLNNIKKVDIQTCWNTRLIKTFQKQLQHMSKYKNVGNTNDRSDMNINDNVDNQLVRVVDLNCPHTQNILLRANATGMFKWPTNWIILGDNNNASMPHHLDIFLDSHVYVIQDDDTIQAFYRLQHEDYYNYQQVAYLENNVLKVKPVLEFTDRHNLRGKKLGVGYVANFHKTIEELLEFRNLQNDVYSKAYAHWAQPVIDVLNATMEPHILPFWGQQGVNSTKWNGLFGLFQDGVLELGATCVFISRSRNTVVSYAGKYPGSGYMIFRAPRLSLVRNILRMPLQDNVWGSILLLLLLQFLIVLVITHWEWSRSEYLGLESISNVLRPRALDVAQMKIGALFQQGSEAEPKSVSGQIATFFTFLSFLFFYTAYSACIVALLQSSAKFPNTLEDIANSDISVKLENISYMQYYVQQALTTPTLKTLYHTKIAPNNAPYDVNYVTLHEGVTKCIRDDFCAMLVDQDRAYKEIVRTYTEAEKCGLRKIQFAPSVNPYTPYRKGSAYKELFRVTLAYQVEVGIRNRVLKRIIATAPKCEAAGGVFRSVSIIDCYFALLSFSVGTSFAIFVYILEVIYFKYQKNIIKKCFK